MSDTDSPLGLVWRAKWRVGLLVLVAVAASIGVTALTSEQKWLAESQIRVGQLALGRYTDAAYVERVLRTSSSIIRWAARSAVSEKEGQLFVSVLPETELLELVVEQPNEDAASELMNQVISIAETEIAAVYGEDLQVTVLTGSQTADALDPNYVATALGTGVIALLLGIGWVVFRDGTSPRRNPRPASPE